MSLTRFGFSEASKKQLSLIQLEIDAVAHAGAFESIGTWVCFHELGGFPGVSIARLEELVTRGILGRKNRRFRRAGLVHSGYTMPLDCSLDFRAQAASTNPSNIRRVPS